MTTFGSDWWVMMAAVAAWVAGQNPYGQLEGVWSEIRFAYPPTALPWMYLGWVLGPAGFVIWTAGQIGVWAILLLREGGKRRLATLLWGPIWIHILLGQVTLGLTLALWIVMRQTRRSWVSGLLLAWAMTKPQAALLPVLWLLWQERQSPDRTRLWAGMLIGTLALALPATIVHPTIWQDWISSVLLYSQRDMVAAAWLGWYWPILLLAGLLWYWSGNKSWIWWLNAAMIPGPAIYSMIALTPGLHADLRNLWSLLGLITSILLITIPLTTMPLALSMGLHLLAAWAMMGGPPPRATKANLSIQPDT